jgi:hypothetical protein
VCSPASGFGERPESIAVLYCALALTVLLFSSEQSSASTGSSVLLDSNCRKISRRPEGACPARAASAARPRAALLVLESRSGITGGVLYGRLIRFDVKRRLLAARQLTPFSVEHPAVSIPTFGSGYLPRFVTCIPHAGHTCAITFVPSGIHRVRFAVEAPTGRRTASFTASTISSICPGVR